MNTKLRVVAISAFLSVAIASCTGMQPGTGSSRDTVSLKEYSDRINTGMPPVNSENKLYVYETMDYWAHTLRSSKNVKKLKTRKTNTFSHHPYLTILDRNGDGRSDQFVYEEKEGSPSDEFGFIFDLNEDGTMDYMVFNGGPMIKKDFKRVMWMNYHLIDSNFDGKIDVLVFNDIDLDGDRETDDGVTAWIYDTDFDGGIDFAEYLGYTPIFPIGGTIWFPEEGTNLQQTVASEDGIFHVSKVTGEKSFRPGDKFVGMQEMLDDINDAIR